MPARLGGEEFLILLPDTGIERAEVVAERLREALAALAIERSGHTIRFTVSLGLTGAQDDEALDALIRRADTALYEAKTAGRNRVCVEG